MASKNRAWLRHPWTWCAATLVLFGISFLLVSNRGLRRTYGPDLVRGVTNVVLLGQLLTALLAMGLGCGRLCSSVLAWKARASGLLAMLGASPSLLSLPVIVVLGGSAWGRPLRVRGRQVLPDLREGSDWEHGERPDPTGLDDATRAALEALWLHDAQKEHASVPAFARVSWLLAATGAPPELLRWSHRAAIEEIAHTRLCFALAAGYGGRVHTVEPMPELASEGLGHDGDVVDTLMIESLGDGCMLEDFNADVAAECATVCDEPVTRRGLERIAREERSHAAFSWAVVEWLVQRDGTAVHAALARAIDGLAGYRRPTAASTDKRALVQHADAAALRRHGRLPDERWEELWQQRLRQTEERARALLAACELAAAP